MIKGPNRSKTYKVIVNNTEFLFNYLHILRTLGKILCKPLFTKLQKCNKYISLQFANKIHFSKNNMLHTKFKISFLTNEVISSPRSIRAYMFRFFWPIPPIHFANLVFQYCYAVITCLYVSLNVSTFQYASAWVCKHKFTSVLSKFLQYQWS